MRERRRPEKRWGKTRFPFTATIGGVERVYREMPKPKKRRWYPPAAVELDEDWRERVEREP